MFEILSSKSIGKILKISSTALTWFGTFMGIAGSATSLYEPGTGKILSLIGYGTAILSSECNLLVTYCYSNNDVKKLYSNKRKNSIHDLALDKVNVEILIKDNENPYNSLTRIQHGINKYKFWINSLCLSGGGVILLFSVLYVISVVGGWSQWFVIPFAAAVTISGLSSTTVSTLLKYSILKPLFRALAKYKKVVEQEKSELEKEEKDENKRLKKLIELDLNIKNRTLLSSHKNYLLLMDFLIDNKNNVPDYVEQLKKLENDSVLEFIKKINIPKLKKMLIILLNHAAEDGNTLDIMFLKKYDNDNIIEIINTQPEITFESLEELGKYQNANIKIEEIKVDKIKDNNNFLNENKNENKLEKIEKENEKIINCSESSKFDWENNSITIFGNNNQNQKPNEQKILKLKNENFEKTPQKESKQNKIINSLKK